MNADRQVFPKLQLVLNLCVLVLFGWEIATGIVSSIQFSRQHVGQEWSAGQTISPAHGTGTVTLSPGLDSPLVTAAGSVDKTTNK
jgi:hypothetical protein